MRGANRIGPGSRTAAALVLLAALVLAAFSPAIDNGFVDHDDDVYLVDNARVRAGISLDGLRWAFGTFHGGNWHPLTWVSHQLDASLFGMDPRGHHLTSLLLHLANAALLFLLWRALTGAAAASLLTAALFAVHPLHVESVAWASERKDVLATFFLLLAAHGYRLRLAGPGAAGPLLLHGAYAASLLAKPMGVSFPLLLLLLDFWPLGRLAAPTTAAVAAPGRRPGLATLLREKAALFLLAAAAGLVTLLAQERGSMLHPIPLAWRLTNAATSAVAYLRQTLLPTGLAAFYPHPEGALPGSAVLFAAATLVALTMLALALSRRQPWLAAGWLWFGVALLPVAGLIQAGEQGRADRYTYLPLVGVFVAVAWGLRLAARRAPRWRPAVVALAAAAVLALLPLTRRQVAVWRNDETLFTQMLAVTRDNWIAHNGLGIALGKAGRYAEAETHFREAVRIRPDFPMAWLNLGNALRGLGSPEAPAAYERAIRLQPGYAPAYGNLFSWYLASGNRAGAEAVRRRLARVDPARAAQLRSYLPPPRPSAPR